MRHRVLIEKPKGGVDAANERDLSKDGNWEPLCKRWAEIKDAGSREVFRARQSEPQISMVIRIRYDNETSSISPLMRVRLNERLLQIKSARDENEWHRTIVLECVEAE